MTDQELVAEIIVRSKDSIKQVLPVNQVALSDGVSDLLAERFKAHAPDEIAELIIRECGAIIRQFISQERACIGMEKLTTETVQCVECGVIIVNARTALDNTCSVCARNLASKEPLGGKH